MRTTLTLDDDVARMLEKLQKEQQKPFKQVVNEVLRKGLVETKSPAKGDALYSTPVLSAGRCKYPNLDNVAEILAVAEREDHK